MFPIKRKYLELDLKTKLELVKDAEMNPKLSRRELALKYGIGKSTVADILNKQRDKILQFENMVPYLDCKRIKAQNTLSNNNNNGDVDDEDKQRESIAAALVSWNNPASPYETFQPNRFLPPLMQTSGTPIEEMLPPLNNDAAGRNSPKVTGTGRPERSPTAHTSARKNLNDFEFELFEKYRCPPLMLLAGYDVRHLLSSHEIERLDRKVYEKVRESSDKSGVFDIFQLFPANNDDEDEEAAARRPCAAAPVITLTEALYSVEKLRKFMSNSFPEGLPYVRVCKELLRKKLREKCMEERQMRMSDFYTRKI